MATERRRLHWRSIVGVVWLALLAFVLLREASVALHELRRLQAAGNPLQTWLDRASQLKPAAWKTPWNVVAGAAYVFVLLGILGLSWRMALVHLRDRKH